MNETKTCTKCGETKARLEFTKRTASADGLQAWCKTCCTRYRRPYDLKRRKTVKYKLYMQQRDQKRRGENRLRGIKQRRKWNDKTQGRRNHRKSWTEQDIALLWDTSYTAKELAEKLHRTYQAIGDARIRFVAHRPKDYCHNGCRKADLSLPETP